MDNRKILVVGSGSEPAVLAKVVAELESRGDKVEVVTPEEMLVRSKNSNKMMIDNTYLDGLKNRTDEMIELNTVNDFQYSHLSKKEREAIIIPVRTEAKIGRNNPCSCGSGKKYKNCCLK